MNALAKSDINSRADTLTIEELINQVKRGLIRIPDFQRPLLWQADDVRLLFDSIYHGYPIGSFLMRQAYAAASIIQYGPLKISAPESISALWVVDGQQRLTALTVGLARDEDMPTTSIDPWVLYFDAQKQMFYSPPANGVIPSTWVPITQLLDASLLNEWVFNWEHRHNSTLRKSVFEAGTQIRQYPIPLYIVETDNEELLRNIFYRINDAGKKIKWDDIHDALFGRKSNEPSTLRGLADELKSLGVGRPSEDQLLSAIIAFKDLDPTRNISLHYRRDPKVLEGAVNEALPALRQVLIFLKTNAEIPHLRLLPRSLPFVVLTKFFGFHPQPNNRTLALLVRWTWRTLLKIKSVDERTLLSHSLNAIKKDIQEEQTIQKLLEVVPRTKEESFKLPHKFDARAADSRIVLVALSSLSPLNPETGDLIDIADLIEKYDLNAFRKIISANGIVWHSPANRIISPPLSKGIQNNFAQFVQNIGHNSKILQTHCIDEQATELLLHDKFSEFLSHRSECLIKAVDRFGSRLAAWGKSDRPSINYILQQTGEE